MQNITERERLQPYHGADRRQVYQPHRLQLGAQLVPCGSRRQLRPVSGSTFATRLSRAGFAGMPADRKLDFRDDRAVQLARIYVSCPKMIALATVLGWNRR